MRELNSVTQGAGFLFEESSAFLKILEGSLYKKSKFSNELRLNMVTMILEKFYMVIIMRENKMPVHHTPMALLKEARTVEEIPESIIQITKFISRFESICGFTDFGYKDATDEDLSKMINGLMEMESFILNGAGQITESFGSHADGFELRSA